MEAAMTFMAQLAQMRQQSNLWRGWPIAIEFSARLIVNCLFCRVSARSTIRLDRQQLANPSSNSRFAKHFKKRNDSTNQAAKKDVETSEAPHSFPETECSPKKVR
jgi:hypothetical protein